MSEIWTMGEMIVEIMRDTADCPLDTPGVFLGPYASGAPAIFIDTVGKCGGSGAIIGAVGNDDFGHCILSRLEGDGVDTSRVERLDSHPTGSAFVTYFSNGDRKFIFHIDGTSTTLAKGVEVMPKGARIFHIMGCSLTASKDFGERIIETMKVFYFGGAKISFDPNIRPELMKDPECMERIRLVMRHTSVFMPGASELLLLTGKEDMDSAVRSCFEDYGMDMIVVKNGSRGSTVYTHDIKYDFDIYQIVPKDATGAGDSFDGAFLTALLRGRSIEKAGKLASAAAALNTAAFGPMEGEISPETLFEMTKEQI